MIREFFSETVVGVVMLLLIIILVNPTGMLMATSTEMMLLVGIVLLFGLFALFVWREKAGDEREIMHRMFADRIGFLAGSATLIFGIIIEGLKHNLSDWLLVALGVMVLAKIFGSIYGKIKH